jgi:hypothetical protein
MTTAGSGYPRGAVFAGTSKNFMEAFLLLSTIRAFHSIGKPRLRKSNDEKQLHGNVCLLDNGMAGA